MQKTDWLVIPSRSDSIPLAFSEAMKLGVPVISSALPDLKYLINKYKVGLLFKPECYQELAGLIEKLPQEKNKWESFYKNTKKAADIFRLDRSVTELTKSINNVG